MDLMAKRVKTITLIIKALVIFILFIIYPVLALSGNKSYCKSGF